MKSYKRINFDKHIFRRQFIITNIYDLIPDFFDIYEQDGYTLGVNDLPIYNVENEKGERLGWCVGYPVNKDNDDQRCQKHIVNKP